MKEMFKQQLTRKHSQKTIKETAEPTPPSPNSSSSFISDDSFAVYNDKNESGIQSAGHSAVHAAYSLQSSSTKTSPDSQTFYKVATDEEILAMNKDLVRSLSIHSDTDVLDLIDLGYRVDSPKKDTKDDTTNGLAEKITAMFGNQNDVERDDVFVNPIDQHLVKGHGKYHQETIGRRYSTPALTIPMQYDSPPVPLEYHGVKVETDEDALDSINLLLKDVEDALQELDPGTVALKRTSSLKFEMYDGILDSYGTVDRIQKPPESAYSLKDIRRRATVTANMISVSAISKLVSSTGVPWMAGAWTKPLELKDVKDGGEVVVQTQGSETSRVQDRLRATLLRRVESVEGKMVTRTKESDVLAVVPVSVVQVISNVPVVHVPIINVDPIAPVVNEDSDTVDSAITMESINPVLPMDPIVSEGATDTVLDHVSAIDPIIILFVERVLESVLTAESILMKDPALVAETLEHDDALVIVEESVNRNISLVSEPEVSNITTSQQVRELEFATDPKNSVPGESPEIVVVSAGLQSIEEVQEILESKNDLLASRFQGSMVKKLSMNFNKDASSVIKSRPTTPQNLKASSPGVSLLVDKFEKTSKSNTPSISSDIPERKDPVFQRFDYAQKKVKENEGLVSIYQEIAKLDREGQDSEAVANLYDAMETLKTARMRKIHGRVSESDVMGSREALFGLNQDDRTGSLSRILPFRRKTKRGSFEPVSDTAPRGPLGRLKSDDAKFGKLTRSISLHFKKEEEVPIFGPGFDRSLIDDDLRSSPVFADRPFFESDAAVAVEGSGDRSESEHTIHVLEEPKIVDSVDSKKRRTSVFKKFSKKMKKIFNYDPPPPLLDDHYDVGDDDSPLRTGGSPLRAGGSPLRAGDPPHRTDFDMFVAHSEA